MEWIKLVIGIGMAILFIWLLVKNIHRAGFFNALFSFDIMIGIIAGFYLIVTAVIALLS